MVVIIIAFILFIFLFQRKRFQYLESQIRSEERLKQVELNRQIEILTAINIEQERISADIHDDMGSNIASINLLSKIMASSNCDEMFSLQIKELKTQTQELSQKLGDIVWAIKSENDNLENLIIYIQNYVVKQLEPLGFSVDIFIPDFISDQVINGVMRKDILMNVKESINNIIKHSQARNVEIHFLFNSETLNIRIKDNGKGLPTPVSYGNGLKQMGKRLKKYDGQIEFINEDGLTVRMTLNYKAPF